MARAVGCMPTPAAMHEGRRGQPPKSHGRAGPAHLDLDVAEEVGVEADVAGEDVHAPCRGGAQRGSWGGCHTRFTTPACGVASCTHPAAVSSSSARTQSPPAGTAHHAAAGSEHRENDAALIGEGKLSITRCTIRQAAKPCATRTPTAPIPQQPTEGHPAPCPPRRAAERTACGWRLCAAPCAAAWRGRCCLPARSELSSGPASRRWRAWRMEEPSRHEITASSAAALSSQSKHACAAGGHRPQLHCDANLEAAAALGRGGVWRSDGQAARRRRPRNRRRGAHRRLLQHIG